MQLKVLIVDDERHLREMVARGIENMYVPLMAKDANAAYKILEQESIDLCIVDVTMPVEDGFSLCDAIKSNYDIPVIMLTARSELNDKRQAFEAGTDDYVTKPFEMEELLFRMKAVLGRYNKGQKIELGNVHMNPDAYEIEISGELLYLPRKEFELLYILCSLYPKVATREQLIERVWGYDFEGDERTIDVHIKRLRKRLLSTGATLQIATVRGIGYKVQDV